MPGTGALPSRVSDVMQTPAENMVFLGEGETWGGNKARIPGRKRGRMGLHPGLQALEQGACGHFPAPAGVATGIRPPMAGASCWWWHLCFSIPQEVVSVIWVVVGSQGPARQHASFLPSRTVSRRVLGVVPFIKNLLVPK